MTREMVLQFIRDELEYAEQNGTTQTRLSDLKLALRILEESL